MSSPAHTLQPPYYAVIFTSVRSEADPEGYARAATLLDELARDQPGFLGIESVRDASGPPRSSDDQLAGPAVPAVRTRGEKQGRK